MATLNIFNPSSTFSSNELNVGGILTPNKIIDSTGSAGSEGKILYKNASGGLEWKENYTDPERYFKTGKYGTSYSVGANSQSRCGVKANVNNKYYLGAGNTLNGDNGYGWLQVKQSGLYFVHCTWEMTGPSGHNGHAQARLVSTFDSKPTIGSPGNTTEVFTAEYVYNSYRLWLNSSKIINLEAGKKLFLTLEANKFGGTSNGEAQFSIFKLDQEVYYYMATINYNSDFGIASTGQMTPAYIKDASGTGQNGEFLSKGDNGYFWNKAVTDSDRFFTTTSLVDALPSEWSSFPRNGKNTSGEYTNVLCGLSGTVNNDYYSITTSSFDGTGYLKIKKSGYYLVYNYFQTAASAQKTAVKVEGRMWRCNYLNKVSNPTETGLVNCINSLKSPTSSVSNYYTEQIAMVSGYTYYVATEVVGNNYNGINPTCISMLYLNANDVIFQSLCATQGTGSTTRNNYFSIYKLDQEDKKWE